MDHSHSESEMDHSRREPSGLSFVKLSDTFLNYPDGDL